MHESGAGADSARDQDAGPAAPAEMTQDELADFAQQVFDVARGGDAAMLDKLLASGLPPNLRNHKGDTLLMLASYNGNVEGVRVLLGHRADPDLPNDKGQMPLAAAAFKGNLPIVRLLVEQGASVDGASSDGRTALIMAAMFNRIEIVDYLLAQGAAIDATDASGVTALAAAEKMGAADTAARLRQPRP